LEVVQQVLLTIDAPACPVSIAHPSNPGMPRFARTSVQTSTGPRPGKERGPGTVRTRSTARLTPVGRAEILELPTQGHQVFKKLIPPAVLAVAVAGCGGVRTIVHTTTVVHTVTVTQTRTVTHRVVHTITKKELVTAPAQSSSPSASVSNTTTGGPHYGGGGGCINPNGTTVQVPACETPPPGYVNPPTVCPAGQVPVGSAGACAPSSKP
jgi:hypothetical protein